ncbi:uncharacterized protein LOC132724016 isoform X2 [Ruditapes philippinarum]|uniref:uncharacterized protein LOC132724016 isoform X2 n=1 Tax=Ruditapes philippinarum TaxID=129788 RepID=UPI00295BFD37|nr:uncharacterized protein LOC132724016 isoform X2 [Ruditapes philippinarum]
MRLPILFFAIYGLVTSVYSFPNSQQHRYLPDIDLKRVLEILQEIKEAGETGNDDEQSQRGNLREAGEDGDNGPDPYIKKEIEYLNLARRIADQYIAEQRREHEDSDHTGSRSTNDALRAFNRPSKRTRMLAEQNEREYAERVALHFLTGASDNLRSLADIDLTAFKAAKDPTCNQVVDCSKESNFVDGKEFRTIDGSCNNKEHFSWGFAGAQHIRLPENNAYQDGKSKIRRNILSINTMVANLYHVVLLLGGAQEKKTGQ